MRSTIITLVLAALLGGLSTGWFAHFCGYSFQTWAIVGTVGWPAVLLGVLAWMLRRMH